MLERCAKLASLALLVVVAHQHVTCVCATSGDRQGQRSFAYEASDPAGYYTSPTAWTLFSNLLMQDCRPPIRYNEKVDPPKKRVGGLVSTGHTRRDLVFNLACPTNQ